MMITYPCRSIACCGLLLLFAGSTSAQQSSHPPALDRGTCGVSETAAGFVAFGDHYKATLDAQRGLRFTPALGSAVQANQTLALRVQSIGRRDDAGGMEPALVASRTLKGKTASFHRAGGIVERYEVEPEGIAMSFWFPSKPAGAGDLRVRLELVTDLSLLLLRDGARTTGGVAFAVDSSPEGGGVHIGEVTGIDAAGARISGSIAVRTAGRSRLLELSLPSSFVDAAAYPLVLDPLISPILPLSASSEDAGAPDVAFDATFDRYLTVYEVRFSSGDVDVRAVLTDGAGGAVTSAIIAATSIYETRPRVIGVDRSNRFLVVWQEAPSPFAGHDVRCRAVNASNGLVSAGSPLVASGSGSQNAPVVGCWRGTDEALVVWRNAGVGLDAAPVTVQLSGDPAPGAIAHLASEMHLEAPAVSRIVDPAGVHAVVYEGRAGRSFALAVDRGLRVLSTGQVLGKGLLDIDGDGWRFVKVHEQFQPTAEVVAEKLVWNGTFLSRRGSRGVSLGVPGHRPAVALVGEKAVVAYEFDVGTAFAQTIRHTQLDFETFQLCGPGSVVSGNSPSLRAATPRIASQASAGGDLEALIVYSTSSTGLFPLARTIEGRIYTPFGGGSVFSVTPGCGPAGGVGGVNGAYAIGNRRFELTLSGADPAAAVVAVSLGIPGTSLACGSCNFTVPQILNVTGQVGGAATWPLPIPCWSFLVGADLEFQWLVFGPASSACSGLPGLSTSDRVQLLNLDY